jgi:predicted enzyme related to lactoylglutathione lyase
MPIKARYVHTNIVAKDWKKLARFYEEVLGCTPEPPERDLSGKWLDAATGLPDAHIRGMHLRLPGYDSDGPTLEIFEYNEEAESVNPVINRPGLAHIAFAVDDVETARQALLAAGGGIVGETASLDVPGAGRVTLAYLTDPEGNIIELLKWSR